MADMQATIVGTVGRDPELRFTGSGKGVCSFSVAVRRAWKQGDEWQEQTTWYNVSVWGDMGENAAATLKKGTRVMMTGVVEMREYETRDGDKGRSLEFRPDEIAVSLRWARAEVEKIERERGGEVRQPRTPTDPDPVYGDEEPF